ncbi:glycoside hydrolase family 43 protein [Rutstroemia sp. NJR-2017a BBW]|nr:glycoside hydrolase family 43 protein [Rutstroemia sp. NJR-2017a BBW]
MFGFLRTLSAGLVLAVGLAQASPNPMACSGVCNNAHDPSILQNKAGTYYRFSTGGGIAIHTAPALTGPWTYKGYALKSSKIDGNTDLWAPDVTLVGNTYYMYYSTSTFGSQKSSIGVATSSTMDVGSWTDHGSSGVSSSSGKAYNAIDGNLIWDGSAFYMNFGSFYGDIYQVPMKNPPISSSGAAYNIEYNSTGTRPSEGSFVFTWGDYFYLFFSSGSCCNLDKNRPAKGEEYKIMVCRSNKVTGGFVDKNGKDCRANGGTEVLASHDHVYAPGGQGLYMDPKYGPVIFYHYVDTTVGYADGDKKLGINKVSFSSGWPVLS